MSHDRNMTIHKKFEEYLAIKRDCFKNAMIVSTKDRYSYYDNDYYKYEKEVYQIDTKAVNNYCNENR